MSFHSDGPRKRSYEDIPEVQEEGRERLQMVGAGSDNPQNRATLFGGRAVSLFILI